MSDHSDDTERRMDDLCDVITSALATAYPDDGLRRELLASTLAVMAVGYL